MIPNMCSIEQVYDSARLNMFRGLRRYPLTPDRWRLPKSAAATAAQAATRRSNRCLIRQRVQGYRSVSRRATGAPTYNGVEQAR